MRADNFAPSNRFLLFLNGQTRFVLFVRNPSDRRHRGVAVEFLLSYSGGNSYSTTIPTSVLLPNKLKLNLQHSPLRN